ncbi:MAG: hypothetical protein HYY25_01095 [Candidatus Wallbacteria bacterium]|nr:hypothetical protein [Candidatus Wallbacteria bacterium]
MWRFLLGAAAGVAAGAVLEQRRLRRKLRLLRNEARVAGGGLGQVLAAMLQDSARGLDALIGQVHMQAENRRIMANYDRRRAAAGRGTRDKSTRNQHGKSQ